MLYMTNVRSYLVEVVADDWGDQIILGRNALNMLKMQLNGMSETISLLE